MHSRTLLILAVVVGALFVLRTQLAEDAAEREDELRQQAREQLLLEGVTAADFGDLRSLVIDNVPRSEQMRFERDSAGRWFMVDPVHWPAEVGVLKLLFDTVLGDRGVVVEDISPADAGLEPPLAICTFEFEERGTFVLEVGGPDLASTKMYARSTGPGGEARMLRVNRALEATFERFVPDYRSKVLTRDEPRNVVEIVRRGPATLPAPLASGLAGPVTAEPANPLLGMQAPFATLDLHLADDKAGWRVTQPFSAAAEPLAVGMLASTLCNLDARGFPAEAAPSLGQFGFDRPELELEVRFIDGTTREVRFARAPGMRRTALENGVALIENQWLCMLDDRPQVFEIDPSVVLLCAGPADAFFDRRIARGELTDISSVELDRAGSTITLAQTDGAWTVSGPTAAGQRIEGRRAEDEACENVFLQLRQAELQELLPDWEGAPTFVLDAFHYTRYGQREGGTFAPPMWTGAGEPPEVRPELLFRRDGDDVWASVDPAVRGLLVPPAEEYLARDLVEVEELVLASIALERGGERLVFERDPATGRWARAGAAEEARDFAVLVDRLRSVRALGFAFGAELPGELVEVTLVADDQPGPRGAAGFELRYQLGAADADGAGDWFVQDGVQARIYPGLAAAVDALFDGS